MIRPHPESDLYLNVMVTAADIVKMLRKKPDFHLVEELMWHFLEKDKKRTPDMFLNSLTFLYSFGLIEQKGYRVKLVQVKPGVQRELF
jgi:hypothetical protein